MKLHWICQKKKCNPFTKVKCKCDIKLCLQFRRETPLKIKMELEHHPTEQENHGKSSSKPPLAHVEFWVKLSHHPVLRTSFVAFCQKIQWLPRRRIFWNLNLLCQWLNFKLLGVTYLVQTFISGFHSLSEIKKIELFWTATKVMQNELFKDAPFNLLEF